VAPGARARRLGVFVSQGKALRLAVRDGRRGPHRAALDRLLAGTLRFIWPLARVDAEREPHAADPRLGDVLTEGSGTQDVYDRYATGTQHAGAPHTPGERPGPEGYLKNGCLRADDRPSPLHPEHSASWLLEIHS
jgi:hypothetical protein